MFQSLDALDERINSARYDVAETARRLGSDPQAVLAFVRDNIHYEHYNGVLRGAAGTLISGAGSTCDQAVLVQELLRETGHRARIRVGVATAAINRALAEKASKAPPASADVSPWIAGDLRAQVDRYFHAVTGGGPEVTERLMTTRAPVPLGRAYCWVETGETNRVVLDPVSGTPPVDLADALSFDVAPESLRHRASLTVRLHGAAGVHQLISKSVNVDELVLSPVTLAVVPANQDLVNRLQSGGGHKVLDQMDAFAPQLTVGGVTTSGRTFNLAGKLAPSGPMAGSGEALGGSLANMLRRGGGERTGRPDTTPSSAVLDPALRVVLEYQLFAPDGSTQTFTRSLFDGASRQTWERGAVTAALIQRHDIMISTFAAPEEYVASRLIRHYRNQRPFLESWSRVAPGGSIKAEDIKVLPLPLLSLFRGQDAAAVALARSHGGSLFRGHPGIVTLRSTYEMREGRLRQLSGIDIVSTGFDALPANGVGKVLRAKLGLYSSIVESKLLGKEVAVSTVLVSEVAARQGVRLVVLSSPEDAQRLAVSQAQRQALVRDLAAGYRVAAYETPLSIRGRETFAWWRIDASTGEILGMVDEGIGGSVQELPLLQTVAIGAAAGAAASYLICYFQEGGGAGYCIGNAACGAVIGGAFSAVVWGILAGYIFIVEETVSPIVGGVWGGVGSVVLDQVLNLCQGAPPGDYDDNDADGRPNDEDPNDDCPSCDDANPPPGNRNDDQDPDDDNDDVPDDQDGCPSDSSDSVDTDGNGVCDSHEMRYGEDADGDGHAEPRDAFPQDPSDWQDSDGDGVGDNHDTHPQDPTRSRDADHDDIDDQVDMDTTRPGPWFPPADDTGDETPQPQWTRPDWAKVRSIAQYAPWGRPTGVPATTRRAPSCCRSSGRKSRSGSA